jgi:ABC-type branched-subunit amino acid transport system ATPase component/branched-subunit amino acid ABC-type transport system permease component
MLGAVLGGLSSAALGLLLARSSAFLYAVLTLAASSAVASIVNNMAWLGGTAGLGGVSRDLFGRGEIGGPALYLLLCSITAVLAVLYTRFRRTDSGRAIEALRLVPDVAQASGVNIAVLRVKLTVLAGAIGGGAGGFYAVLQQYVSSDLLGANASVNFLAMNIIGGSTVALAGLPGAFIAVGLPQLFQGLVSYQIILVGVIMGTVALWFRRGVAGTLQDLWWNSVRSVVQRRSPPAVNTVQPATRARPARDATVLEVSDVTVTFGGVMALRDVTLTLRAGRVHALVGPNGAGKSTLVGMMAGSLASGSGTVKLRGHDVTRLKPDQRAGAGITRTFQLVALCDTLTAVENVMLGNHATQRSSFVRDFFALHSRAAERELADRARTLLSMLGAESIAENMPQQLTSGQQRLIEIARCLMTDADVMLLDEPAAGLSSTERARLAAVIRDLARTGRAVLLIEHDMDFVMALAEHITVLAGGAVLADDSPDKVRGDPRVIAAYWGLPVSA